MVESRRCKVCLVKKPLDQFALGNWKRDGTEKLRLYTCRKCRTRRKVLRRYSMTEEEYNQLAESQQHRCAICRIPFTKLRRRFDVDHDHKTGRNRGLLCSNCNVLIGYAKEDITILKSAISYLKKNDLDRRIREV